MTYLLLALPFVAVAAAAGVLLMGARTPGQTARRHWLTAGAAFLVLAILTAVFDSLMIHLELFHYDPAQITGIRIGQAPIEDFAYPLVCVLVLPALWRTLTHRRAQESQQEASGLVVQAFHASRPVSWINTAYPFAVAMFLTTQDIDWVLIVGTLYFLIAYNLAMYGINDVFDYASDLQNPRKGGMEGALLAPRLHRPLLWLVAITNVPLLLVLGFAGNTPAVWASLAVSAFAVVAYSAPGLRFKERPVLDSLTSSTHFVSPAVVGLTLAGAEFTPGLITVLGAFFLWGMAAHAFGAVQDIVPDRAGGIGSIATVFGAKWTVRLSMMLWLVAGLAMLATEWPGPLAGLIVIPYLINCAPWWNVTNAHASTTNRAWRRFIWLNYGSGFLVTMLLIFAWRLAA